MAPRQRPSPLAIRPGGMTQRRGMTAAGQTLRSIAAGRSDRRRVVRHAVTARANLPYMRIMRSRRDPHGDASGDVTESDVMRC